MSIIVEPEDFFGQDQGIYVPGALWDSSAGHSGSWTSHPANYHQSGPPWERFAHVEIYSEAGALEYSSPVGVRIHGNTSAAFPCKSLRLYLRDEYGSKDFSEPPIPARPSLDTRRLLLRTSGQEFGSHIFRDVIVSQVAIHATTHVDAQAHRFARLFVNGEYWGVHAIRERLDRYFVEERYGVDDDLVAMLSGYDTLDEGIAEDLADWLAVLDFASTEDLANDTKFDWIAERIDIDNYIDHAVLEAWSANPNRDRRWWRKRTPATIDHAPAGHDGRWRWFLYDSDAALFDVVPQVDAIAQRLAAEPLFAALCANDGFRKRLLVRASDLLNSALLPERVEPFVDAIAATLAPHVERHIERWGYPESLSTWNLWLQITRSVIGKRRDELFVQLAAALGVEGTAQLEVKVEPGGAGEVVVGTLEQSPVIAGWMGTVFRGIPVPLKAKSLPGHVFVGWSNGDSDWATSVELGEDTTVVARFAPSPR